MAKGLTAAEIDKLPLSEANKARLKAHYGVGDVEDLGGDTAPATAEEKAADAAKAKSMGYYMPGAVEDLGGDTGPVTQAQKAYDAQRAAAMGYAPAPVKIIQPAPVYVPAAPASATIGKIGPATMGEPVQAAGPALDVDSAGIGSAAVPAYATKAPTLDYGSADNPYEVGELGGLGMTEPDKIVVKKPKEMAFEPDVVTASVPGAAKKYAAKGK